MIWTWLVPEYQDLLCLLLYRNLTFWYCLCADGLGGHLALCSDTERWPWPCYWGGFLYDDCDLPHTKVHFIFQSLGTNRLEQLDHCSCLILYKRHIMYIKEFRHELKKSDWSSKRAMSEMFGDDVLHNFNKASNKEMARINVYLSVFVNMLLYVALIVMWLLCDLTGLVVQCLARPATQKSTDHWRTTAR